MERRSGEGPLLPLPPGEGRGEGERKQLFDSPSPKPSPGGGLCSKTSSLSDASGVDGELGAAPKFASVLTTRPRRQRCQSTPDARQGAEESLYGGPHPPQRGADRRVPLLGKRDALQPLGMVSSCSDPNAIQLRPTH